MATLEQNLGANTLPLSRPETVLRTDHIRRYERGGVVYADDGRLGTLRQIVVDENAGVVTALVMRLDRGGDLVLLSPQAVSKTGGSAVFLSGSYHQYEAWLERAPRYQLNRGMRANIKALLNAGPRQAKDPRVSVLRAGRDFVETGTPQ